MSLPPPDPSRPARTELQPPDTSRPAPPPFPGEPALARDPGPPTPSAVVLTPDEVIERSSGAEADTAAGTPADPPDSAADSSTDPEDGPTTGSPVDPRDPTPEGATPPPTEAPDAAAAAAGANLPAASPSRALVPIAPPDGADGPRPNRRGLAKRWSLPAWAWLGLGAVVVAGAVVAVATRPDDDSKLVAALEEEIQAKDAELLQAQADAQQEAFDDVQDVRDEAEQQLSAAASAREQAEQAAEQADARYNALLEAEIVRVQEEANSRACSDADAAGYAQAAKPDPATFGPAEVANLPADTAAAILARLDMAAITASVDSCYQTGSDRYMSQTTTTTTVAPDPPADPNAPPADGGSPPG